MASFNIGAKAFVPTSVPAAVPKQPQQQQWNIFANFVPVQAPAPVPAVAQPVPKPKPVITEPPKPAVEKTESKQAGEPKSTPVKEPKPVPVKEFKPSSAKEAVVESTPVVVKEPVVEAPKPVVPETTVATTSSDTTAAASTNSVSSTTSTTTTAIPDSQPEPEKKKATTELEQNKTDAKPKVVADVPKGDWATKDEKDRRYTIEDMKALESTIPRELKERYFGFWNNVLKGGKGGMFAKNQRRRVPTSANGWKMLSPEARAQASAKVQLILNRLVSTNCDEMTQEILKLELNSQPLLENLVEQIYEKAVKEVKWVKIYGKMCGKLEEAELHKRIEDLPEGSNLTFRKLLTDHCYKAFKDDLSKWKEARSKPRESLPQEKIEELDLEETKAKGRYLGNIQFIAQLFLVKIVSVKVLTDCIGTLIQSNDPPEQECIETMCKLVQSVGKQLQEKLSTRDDKAKFFMEALFKRFDRYSRMADKYPPRIRFLLLDTIEKRTEWNPPAPVVVPRATSPMLHAPTPLRSSGRTSVTPVSVTPTQTPLPSISRSGSEMVLSPPIVSPDPFKVTPESQQKAINTILTELSQFIDSKDREEFMASMRTMNKDLYCMVVPGVLRFLLDANAKEAKNVLESVVQLLVDFVDEEGVKVRDGLDYFRNDFLEYGEDSPVFAAEVTGAVFSALSKNDPEGEVFHTLFNCLAQLASENPFWNYPSPTARAAGFAATVMVEMLSDIVGEQKKLGRDPYADLCGVLDREPIDVRAIMPDSPDAKKSLSALAALVKEKSLEPLFPVLCDTSLVIDPLTKMQPLTPESLSKWIEGATKAREGTASYFSVLVAEEVFRTLKTTTQGGDVQLAPWIPVLKLLKGTSTVRYEVGLLNSMCQCWSATGKKPRTLNSMAALAKDSGLITKFAFDQWRVDSSDRNSTLKDEAYVNELSELF